VLGLILFAIFSLALYYVVVPYGIKVLFDIFGIDISFCTALIITVSIYIIIGLMRK
jgi:hypothetical protein